MNNTVTNNDTTSEPLLGRRVQPLPTDNSFKSIKGSDPETVRLPRYSELFPNINNESKTEEESVTNTKTNDENVENNWEKPGKNEKWLKEQIQNHKERILLCADEKQQYQIDKNHVAEYQICEALIRNYKMSVDTRLVHEELHNKLTKQLPQCNEQTKEKQKKLIQEQHNRCLACIQQKNILLEMTQDWIKEYQSELSLLSQGLCKELYQNNSDQWSFYEEFYCNLCNFFLNINLIHVIYNVYKKDLNAKMKPIKNIKKMTFHDLMNTLADSEENEYGEHIDLYPNVKELEIDKLDEYMGMIAINKSLKQFCERTIKFTKRCYDGNYIIFCKNLAMQLVDQIDWNGVYEDGIDTVTLSMEYIQNFTVMLNDPQRFLRVLYPCVVEQKMCDEQDNAKIESSRRKYECVVAVICCKMPPRFDNDNESVARDMGKDDRTLLNEKLNHVLKVCDGLKLDRKSKQKIEYFYEHFGDDVNPFCADIQECTDESCNMQSAFAKMFGGMCKWTQ